MLNEEFFTRPSDAHGVYCCKDCIPEADEDSMRATCNVCLSDDGDLHMKIAVCGHSYCVDCLNRLATNDRPQCPVCQHRIETEIFYFSFEEAATIFIREWNESREECVAEIQAMMDEETESD